MMSYNENKTDQEIILLPFCCFHVQGHQKPTLETEFVYFTKGQNCKLISHTYAYIYITCYSIYLRWELIDDITPWTEVSTEKVR